MFVEINQNGVPVSVSYRETPKKGYGCGGFLFDILMVFITGGLWLIWIFVREMRRH